MKRQPPEREDQHRRDLSERWATLIYRVVVLIVLIIEHEAWRDDCGLS